MPELSSDLDNFIRDIIRREGGYVNHPADRGGPTKYGITIANYRRWIKNPKATAWELLRITVDDALEFYRWYFAECKIDNLPVELLPLAIDLCTLHSPRGVGTILNRVANCYDTTRPRGQVFHDLVEQFGPRTTKALITLSRVAYFRELCNLEPNQKAFLLGWLNRCAEFEPWKNS